MIYLNDHIGDFDLASALRLLSSQRRDQALRFRHEAGQRACVAAYLLLCEGLRREYGIEERPLFGYGEHGKPFIVGHPEIFFNFSHCREAVVCALSDRPVGVDVESVGRCKPALLRHVMSEEEQALIAASADPDLAFTRLWTMKEAVVKWSGRGLTTEMKHLLKEPPSRLDTMVSPDGRYVCSVCGGLLQLAEQ